MHEGDVFILQDLHVTHKVCLTVQTTKKTLNSVRADLREGKRLCKEINSKNPKLLWKWVSGSRSHWDFFLEHRPKKYKAL